MSPSNAADAAQSLTPRASHQSSSAQSASEAQAQQVAELVLMIGPAAVSLARQLRDIVLDRRQAARSRTAEDIEEEDQVSSAHAGGAVSEIERTALARMLASLSELLYDYSGGAYGSKPPSVGALRRARKHAEHEARVAARAAEGASGRHKRWRVALPLLVVGMLCGAGAVTLAIWQREQVRAAATQAMGAGRAALRQLQVHTPAGGSVPAGHDGTSTTGMSAQLSTTDVPLPDANTVPGIMSRGAAGEQNYPPAQP